MKGIVYIVRNPLEEEGVYKVGCTSSGDALNRTRTGQTWNSENLEIIREFEVEDCFAAEAAAHRALFNHRIREDREIFKCDLDILIGLVKDSIMPWLSDDHDQIFNNDWLTDLLKEYDLGHIQDCGFCHNKFKEFINELLIRATTNPVGLAPDERVIHNQYTSILIKNMQIGKTIEEALKKINPEKLLELNYWPEALDCLFSLDADKGFLSFRSDFPEDEMHERMRTRNLRINPHLLIKINGFNINQVIHYWSENLLPRHPDLLRYCTKVVNKKRENKDFGFVEGAIVAASNAALNYFENLERNNEWEINEYFLEKDYFKSLSFIKDIGSCLVETFPGMFPNEVTDKHLNIKKKLNSLFLKRADFERREKEETEEMWREIYIDEKAADLSIPKEWAAILFDSGDNSSTIADSYYLNHKNKRLQKRFSRMHHINNINIIIYARDNDCELNQAIWHFYINSDKQYIIDEKRRKIKKEKKLKEKKLRKKEWNEFQSNQFVERNSRIDLLQNLWDISSKNAHRIDKIRLTVKRAIEYKDPIIHNKKNKKKSLLKQRERLDIQHKNYLLNELKSLVEKSFRERRLDALDFKISIDKKYSVLHIIRNNVEKIATLTHIDGYKLWFFDQFPFKENRRYDNINDLIQNCLNFKQDESIEKSPDTPEKKTIVENNPISFRINFKNFFWIGALLFVSSLLLN